MTKDGSIVCAVLPGGGMAGAFTIQIIKSIDDKLKGSSGKGFHETVDLYCGTSTGAIIAGGLVSGMSVDQVYDLYMQGKKYFQYAAPWYVPNKLHIPRYKRDPILSCLLRESNGAIEATMQQVQAMSGKHIMLSTVNKNFKYPLNEFIKSWNANFADMKLIDAVAASFAASIYFGNINNDQYKIVFGDGGEGDSNNPIIEAYCSICDLYPGKKVKMLNIGTGWYNEDVTYVVAKKSGGVADALKVPMMARSQSTKTAVYWAGKVQKRDRNFEFFHIDGKFPNAQMDVLDGIEYISAYKNLALQTMDVQTTLDVLEFLC